MDTQTKIDFIGNEEVRSNHSFKHYIVGQSEDHLLNRKSYVLGAIDAWKENRYNADKLRQLCNIEYFESELRLIENELAICKKSK